MKVGGTLRSSISRGARLMSMSRNDRGGISVQRLTKSDTEATKKAPRGAKFETGREQAFIVQNIIRETLTERNDGDNYTPTTILHHKYRIQTPIKRIRRDKSKKEESRA